MQELDKKLQQLIMIQEKIKELEELKAKLLEQVQDYIEDKMEVGERVVSPTYYTSIKIIDDGLTVEKVIEYGYKDALKIDARKLYEIGDEKILKSLEKENKKSIRIVRKKRKQSK